VQSPDHACLRVSISVETLSDCFCFFGASRAIAFATDSYGGNPYADVQFGNGVRVEWRNAVIKARIAERRL
jgi:hypothetical protein